MVKAMLYKPTDRVRYSGLYVVVHDPVHSEAHEVTCVKGRQFPVCIHCGNGARFGLKKKTIHVEDHPYFKTDD